MRCESNCRKRSAGTRQSKASAQAYLAHLQERDSLPLYAFACRRSVGFWLRDPLDPLAPPVRMAAAGKVMEKP